jgi:hypothetical protein
MDDVKHREAPLSRLSSPVAVHMAPLEETVLGVPRSHKHHFVDPFLVVTCRLRDIGLVGWNDRRWSHQDKAPAKRSRKGKGRRLPETHASETPWKQAFDPDTSRYYFYNKSAGLTVWDEPKEGFLPDATVQHYVDLGVAPTYIPSTPPKPATLSATAGNSPDEATPIISTCPSPKKPAPELDRPPSVSTDTHTPPQVSAGDTPAHTGSPAVFFDAKLQPASILFSPSCKGELPDDVERYWLARYSLMSKWSQGVKLDRTSLFSITPEVIAKHHAQMLGPCAVVLDAFCGSGGNAVQLAKVADKVRI